MGTLSVRLPASLHEHIRRLAKEEGASINQFIVTAVAEKISAIKTASMLEERARKGDLAAFEQILQAVPDRSPLDEDRL